MVGCNTRHFRRERQVVLWATQCKLCISVLMQGSHVIYATWLASAVLFAVTQDSLLKTFDGWLVCKRISLWWEEVWGGGWVLNSFVPAGGIMVRNKCGSQSHRIGAAQSRSMPYIKWICKGWAAVGSERHVGFSLHIITDHSGPIEGAVKHI